MSGLVTGTVGREPHDALRGLVAPYHGYRYAGLEPGVHHGLPSSGLTVVIAFDDPLDVGWLGVPASRGRHWVLASGLHTAPALIRHDGTQHGIQLALTPEGTRALLGLPAGALAAELVPVGDLVGRLVEEAYDRIAGAITWQERFAALDAALLRLFRRTPPVTIRPELSRAWTRLEGTRGRLDIGTLAEETGWSRRHLAGQFKAEYGLTPKQAARVMRFEHSWDLLRVAPRRLAEVAATTGYADQAHMTREWRELAGYTPAEWRRREFPFLQDHEGRG